MPFPALRSTRHLMAKVILCREKSKSMWQKVLKMRRRRLEAAGSHQNVAQRATPSERVPGSKAGTAAKAMPSRLSSLSHLRYKGSIQ